MEPEKEAHNMKLSLYFGILSIVVLALLVNGCSTDSVYMPPAKVEQAAQPAQIQPPAPVPTQTAPSEPEVQAQQPTPAQPEQPKVPIFKVGETATDNQLKVSVNAVRFSNLINEQNNEFLVAKAPAGQEYAIVDLTVENILPDKTQTVSTLIQTKINDQDGYDYILDVTGLMALSKSFKDGDILPNMKKRGETSYLVPANAAHLKFIFEFDAFIGTSAVFDIK